MTHYYVIGLLIAIMTFGCLRDGNMACTSSLQAAVVLRAARGGSIYGNDREFAVYQRYYRSCITLYCVVSNRIVSSSFRSLS